MRQKNGRVILILLVLTMAISGCATMRSNRAPKVEPKVRVQQLEEELKHKDAEIAALKDEMAQDTSRYSSRGSSSSDYGSFSGQGGGSIVSSSLSISVKSVQKALKNAGHYTGSIDGQAGAKTKDAVKAFQRSQGLKADGVVGRKTWAALSRYLN